MAINKYMLFIMLHDGADVVQTDNQMESEIFLNALAYTEMSIAERDDNSEFPKYYLFSDDGFIETSDKNAREDLMDCGISFLPVRSFIARMKEVCEEDDL